MPRAEQLNTRACSGITPVELGPELVFYINTHLGLADIFTCGHRGVTKLNSHRKYIQTPHTTSATAVLPAALQDLQVGWDPCRLWRMEAIGGRGETTSSGM